MVSKDRKRLIDFGMQKEFDKWKQNLPKDIEGVPVVGTRVRFKRLWRHPYKHIELGTEGIVITGPPAYKDLICVRPYSWPQNQAAHLGKLNVDAFLEII